MPRRESWYARYPDYRVDLEPSADHVRVLYGDRVLADSRRTLRVEETGHAPVIYFPLEDVRTELLEASAHATFCPFKGDASYWSLRLDGQREENLVWTYRDPFPEVAGLRGHAAFYADRVRIEEGAP